ncbi:ABC transporter ATP-binding protein [Anaeromyxobacter sp. Fw109-5]|uniref:ABC transporter ATP-binding protein n=1 Tax=Anaeromyxobacter sp. (strain Fw109-5) TaxID=404589 RepID=UPI000158A528|nr:ABC transporter ATP-binding protein [Anaeromyxobacter sp. Fw109-5]ABS25613.1 ABC transporter related [Anaeromyxobacter sp. Fw109-5]
MSGSLTFENVGMRFRMYRERVTTLKEAVLGRFRHLRTADEFWALRDVSFRVGPGEAVGLIGHNGSGKSTLLKIAAGVLRASEGRADVRGRVSPMIELAAGFDPELTGRDNVFLNGALMGHSRKEMAQKFDRIVEFSELGEFIDMPVKNYSSGMYARLGFAIAVDVEPEILMIDEVLAVGDERFQAKCMDRIRAIKQAGCTIFYVSHAMDQVEELCERVIVLHHGRVEFDGAPVPAIARYRELQGFVPHAATRAG